MDTTDSVRLLAASITPLVDKFGSGLTLAREWNCVQWSYEGHSTIVEFTPGEELHATFITAPVLDEVSARPVCAVYRSRSRQYRLTEQGGSAMVDDMVAFFSGVREPRFSFVNAYSPPA